MNEFQRRMVDTVDMSTWIMTAARKSQKILDIEYYNYNVTIGPIASGANGQGVIQIQSDSDFAIAYMSAAQVVNNTPNVSNASLIQITDTGTGKTFFSNPTLIQLVMGSNGLPFYLPAPRVVSPNNNLLIAIQNLNSAANATYYVNFYGARLYYSN